MAVAELPLTLDRTSPTPLSAQVAAQLRRAILEGTVGAPHHLPSSRRLAAELGVSRGVVVRAYEQLTGEGYLEGHGAAGTRVAVRADVRAPTRATPPRPREEPSHPVIDLTPGRPSDTPFADRSWRTAWREAVAEPGHVDLPPALGTPRLRAAIAGHLATARGLSVDPEDVIVTAGTSDALQLIVTALRSHSPAPRVLVEDPGYPTARRVLTTAGAQVETLPVGPDGLRATQLTTVDPVPEAVLITPSHQYPLGGRMPVQERLALLEWAAEHRVLVLEDDYDSEFRHRRMPLPATASLPSQAEVVLLGSFSKTLSPWLRCGYLVVRGTTGNLLKETRTRLDTPVSGVLQSALAHYIEEGGLARHTARARRAYTHRRTLLLDRLADRPGLELDALEGGLHAVLRLPAPVDAEDLAAMALTRGVRVVPLTRYYAHRPPENGLVIGYGAPTDLQLTRALDILIQLLDTTVPPGGQDRT
ncbi:HTH-type pyridoxine biosynthesis transcriptional regulator PdxR [Kocuria dechangensis]|uniref:HTH-type pyridoxine biosynthesis transcriptional regulator PdxR n=1 Tax=Kocuria dechangensis TaxID=1176249 RepID=A0A917H694_9MICC|nr:PLP-dependent aminotransferase family protein [Kocuria dechangensis]GGG68825.1 HTH-type pyridoxine biosynthesis transcriptional regulator PdxR [Kocuria dechangensis]